jgi:hypothetical protein
MGEMKCTYEVLIRKSKEMRPLGRRRRRLEDNIRMDLKERGWKVIDCMVQVKGPVSGSFEHDDKPSDSIKGGEILNQVSDY